MRRATLALILLAACDSKPAPTPVKAPTPPTQDLAATMVDPDEYAVQEIERTLGKMADALEAFAVDTFVSYLPEDFRGTPIGAAPAPVTADPSIPGVVIQPWAGGLDGDVAHFRETLTEFLKPFARISYAAFKVPAFKREKQRATGSIRVIMDAIDSEGAPHFHTETFDAAFEERAEGWRIVHMTRTAGRDVRATRPIFTDATEGAGLTLEPPPLRTDIKLGREPYTGFGGIAAGDIDGDGDADLYVPRIGPDVLFRNDGGKFTRVTKEAGLGADRVGTGALFFDADNDGDLDLLVSAYAPRDRALTYYENDGAGHFTDRTETTGFTATGPAMTACAADVDGDGDLDVFVCMYKVLEESPYPSRILDARNGEPDQLWINDGRGHFTEEGKKRGVADSGWTWAAGFCDYDNDGDSDLAIANDFGKERLFRNRGDGTFEDVTAKAGIAGAGFGMGIDWNDFDGDGDFDLYVSKMYSTAGNRILSRGPGPMSKSEHDAATRAASGNTLYRNNGDGTFTEVPKAGGAQNALWAWDAHGFDYNNDGALDYYVANGYLTGPSRADL